MVLTERMGSCEYMKYIFSWAYEYINANHVINSSFWLQFQVHFEVAFLLKGQGYSSPVTSVLPARPAKHCTATWETEPKKELNAKKKNPDPSPSPPQEIAADILVAE